MPAGRSAFERRREEWPPVPPSHCSTWPCRSRGPSADSRHCREGKCPCDSSGQFRASQAVASAIRCSRLAGVCAKARARRRNGPTCESTARLGRRFGKVIDLRIAGQNARHMLPLRFRTVDHDRDLRRASVGSQVRDGLRKGPTNHIDVYGHQHDIGAIGGDLEPFSTCERGYRFKTNLREQSGHFIGPLAIGIDDDSEGRIRPRDRAGQDFDNALRTAKPPVRIATARRRLRPRTERRGSDR